jgi:catechol 2,3-dioxygenase-like lactoylglutathione lyase family enzyme
MEGLGTVDVNMNHAFLRLGNTILELLEYQRPLGRDFNARAFDVGAVHICFQVDDLVEKYDALRGKGIRFKGTPQEHENDALGRFLYVFFLDPDGIELELYQPLRRESE